MNWTMVKLFWRVNIKSLVDNWDLIADVDHDDDGDDVDEAEERQHEEKDALTNAVSWKNDGEICMLDIKNICSIRLAR